MIGDEKQKQIIKQMKNIEESFIQLSDTHRETIEVVHGLRQEVKQLREENKRIIKHQQDVHNYLVSKED